MQGEQICLVSCFALSDPRCAQFLNRLGEALAARDVQLLVLGTRHAPELTVPQVSIPYSILGFDKEILSCDQPPFHAVEPVAVAERLWSGTTVRPDTVARSIAKCEWFYQAVAEELRPAAALLWNTTHPHSRIARDVLQANDIPAWGFERGQLTGTYQVQLAEVNAWSDLRASFAQHVGFDLDLERQQDTTAFDAALALSRAAPIDRHPLRDAPDPTATTGRNGPTILVLTSAVASSIEPVSLRSIGLSQPLWSGLQGILDALDAALPHDATIVFRDHPINREVGASARVPARFREANGVPIAELIEQADRVACVGTTTLQYEALLRDKPLLVLGRSPATDADAAYAPRSTDLHGCIAEWMDDRDGARKRERARALIGLLCERHLVREDDRAAHVHQDVNDLADFIVAQAVANTIPVADRLDRFAERIYAACSIGEPA